MNTKALRQKILDLAIHGKLVPQDPNDEPASVLLERIRAEKERLIKKGKIKKPKKTKAACDKPHYPFELPEGWVWTTVGEVCSSFSTGPFGSMVHKSDYVSTNGTPIINPANIVNGRILNDGIKKVSNDKVVELTKYRLSENDILLARRGDLTKCAIVTNSHVNSLCGTGTFFLHLIFVSPQYFKYVYSSNLVQDILKKDCVGATMDNLNQSVLANIYIPIPPLEEQMRVNKILEYYFSLLNLIEDEGNNLQVTIKQAKSIILDLAIHGKLVPQDPNDEPAVELLKRINPKAEIACDNPHYQNLPFSLPNSGTWCSHNQVFDISGGSQPAKSQFITQPQTGCIRLYQIRDYGEKPMPVYIPIESATKQTAKGDILLARYGGSLGKVFIAEDGAYNVAMAKVIIKNENMIFKDYAYYYYLSNLYQRKLTEISRTAQAGFNAGDFEDLFFPLPPYKEQERIVNAINKAFTTLDTIMKNL